MDMGNIVAALSEQLERNFSACDTRERRQLFSLFLTEFVEPNKIQALYTAYSLIEGVKHAFEEKEEMHVRTEIPCIITPNVEEEVMPSNVREYLILGYCDLGRIIAPKGGCTLYHVEREYAGEDPEMTIRNYEVETPDGTRRFAEYFSRDTSAFGNDWA